METSFDTIKQIVDTLHTTTVSQGDSSYVPLTPLLTALGILLSLSLFIERLMAVFSWIMEKLFIAQTSSHFERQSDKDERKNASEKAKKEAALLTKTLDFSTKDEDEIMIHPDYPEGKSRFDIKYFTPDEPVNKIKKTKEFWIQFVGSFIAVGVCYYSKISVWGLLQWSVAEFTNSVSLRPTGENIFEYIFTGIIIGAGSKPVNFLIKFLINRKIVLSRVKTEPSSEREEERTNVSKEEKKEGTSVFFQPTSVVTPSTVEEIVGFTYDGGDRPWRLEHTHKWQQGVNIDLIVYHHTTMHSDASFAELVKEFDRKNWLTGYHCVVMKDGTIHILCRWDRFGNHALGYNQRSLGIALQGNFETNPAVPFSNVKGAKGILHPTPLQIESMAKITTLWSLMYQVPLVFERVATAVHPVGILPHKALANKSCPGSNFPYEEFQNKVRSYHGRWKNDQSFQTALETFKLRFQTQTTFA
ncbi:MAG: N-acetylmuramoyl-L-alanine amidase [Ignavibacteriae bacterium]|nr:N-acetylmuramoyl-L-alanine amidase [Ignavibacteriota bacterium]